MELIRNLRNRNTKREEERNKAHKKATNLIYDTLHKKLKPRRLLVVGDFSPRGNVKTIIRVNSEGA